MQLNEELQKKEERIADLELQLLNHSEPVAKTTAATATPHSVCPYCLRGQSSDAASSPGVMSGGYPVSPGDRQLAMVPNLSPIEEGRDGVFGQLGNDDNGSVAGGNRRSGNHSNKTTPTRRRKLSVLDREQQEVVLLY